MVIPQVNETQSKINQHGNFCRADFSGLRFITSHAMKTVQRKSKHTWAGLSYGVYRCTVCGMVKQWSLENILQPRTIYVTLSGKTFYRSPSCKQTQPCVQLNLSENTIYTQAELFKVEQ